jgi:hypothetical protein
VREREERGGERTVSRGETTHHTLEALLMVLLLPRLDPIRRDPLLTPHTLGLIHPQIASLAISVSLVNEVRLGEGVLLAFGERGGVDERVAAVGTEEVGGMVGADGSRREEERVRNVDVLRVGDGRLAVEALLGVVLLEEEDQLVS